MCSSTVTVPRRAAVVAALSRGLTGSVLRHPSREAAPRALVVDDAMMRAVTCTGDGSSGLGRPGDPRLDRAITGHLPARGHRETLHLGGGWRVSVSGHGLRPGRESCPPQPCCGTTPPALACWSGWMPTLPSDRSQVLQNPLWRMKDHRQDVGDRAPVVDVVLKPGDVLGRVTLL